jgi:putative heme-binding domain-containing protein
VSREYDPSLVDGLLEKLSREKNVRRLREYADRLARVYKKPGPWVYWDYRPKPRPANQVAWERTAAIAAALNRLLAQGEPQLRLAVLRIMQRENISVGKETLGSWLKGERDPQRVAALLAYLHDHPMAASQLQLGSLILDSELSTTNRLAGLSLFVRGMEKQHAASLLAISQRLEDGPVLAESLVLFGKYRSRGAASLLKSKLDSNRPEVRSAAIQALGELQAAEGREPLTRLLADPDPTVRSAAAAAAGKLQESRAIAPLLALAADRDGPVRGASLAALLSLKEPRAVPLAVAAIGDRETEQIALESLRVLGGPEQSAAVTELAKHSPSLDVLTAVVQTLNTWRERPTTKHTEQQALDRAVAEIHGSCGNLVRWYVSGPHKADDAIDNETAPAQIRFATGTEGNVVIAAKGAQPGSWYVARTDVAVTQSTDVELLGSSSCRLRIWINRKSIYRRQEPKPFRIDSDRVSVTLAKGNNRLAVSLGPASPESPIEFQLRFRRKSVLVDHERLLQAALSQSGNIERGRSIFLNVEKSLCLNCHRLGNRGGRTGPELTGLGSRYSRIYIAESILQPSRTIAPSFGTVVAALTNGKVVSGVKVDESETVLTLADSQGREQKIVKADIEQQTSSILSTMPEGLEKHIREEEFVDLVAFLTSLKTGATP